MYYYNGIDYVKFRTKHNNRWKPGRYYINKGILSAGKLIASYIYIPRNSDKT